MEEDSAIIKPAPQLPLTDECHHYTHISEVPWDIQKYWHQRYSIFSQYDDDIHLTDEAWFGVTPEPVARAIAAELAASPLAAGKTTLVDLFGGAGGNAIAFAASGRWDRVVAVERDPATLACAQRNAAAYGVAARITWVLADSLAYLARLRAGAGTGAGTDAVHPALRLDPARTVCFASPPWGGPGYRSDDVFDLGRMQPYGLGALREACAGMDAALYLPRTSDLRQIAALVPAGDKVEVVQYCMQGASKAMVAYIPASFNKAA